MIKGFVTSGVQTIHVNAVFLMSEPKEMYGIKYGV